MSPRFPLAAAVITSLAATLLIAQTAPSAQPSTGPAPATDAPAPPFSSTPETYSGISGPGKPVTGNGGGGWRSNQDTMRYDGLDPLKPGWQPLAQFACTSQAVKDGLIPPLKPIWDLHLRDTIIILSPADNNYYMTGSTGDNIWDRNDGIEVYRSKDLKSWEYLGLVWSFERDASPWQKKWGTIHNHPGRDIWAPEIHYIKSKKNYFLTYCLATGGTGILASTTGKAEGPYTSPLKPDARLGGGIDLTMFEDDDGKVYVTSGRGGYVALMKDDMSGIASQRNVVCDKSDATSADGKPIPPDQRTRTEVASEGASLFKRNGKYYLGGATFWGGSAKGRYDSVVAISDNIYGPYKQFHEAVPCGGGTNYFQDKDGTWFCAYFGNDEQTPFREKPGIVKIDFDKDNKIFIADEQPAWILQEGANTQWRNPPRPAPTTPPK